MIGYFITYEIFGYIAIVFNFIAFIQQTKRLTLIYLIITAIFFILNMITLDLAIVSIYIASTGLFLTVTALVLINNERIRNLIIKTSPIFMLLIVYLYGFNIVGLLAGLGFLLATVAKLQNNIFNMKIYLLLSSMSWLGLMIYLDHISFIIYYIQGIAILIFSLYKIRKKDIIIKKGLL